MIINLGDAPFKAFITVTYPNGTCTVSLGNKSFTHSGGGTHTFTVNKKGTWTVRATSTTGVSVSRNVSITERMQTASITLNYRNYLYNAGTEYTTLVAYNAGGYVTVTKNASNISIDAYTYSAYGGVYSTPRTDVSRYNKLCVQLSSSLVEYAQGVLIAAVDPVTSAPALTGALAILRAGSFSGSRLLTLDISNVSLCGFQFYVTGLWEDGKTGRMSISQIWLDV